MHRKPVGGWVRSAFMEGADDSNEVTIEEKRIIGKWKREDAKARVTKKRHT